MAKKQHGGKRTGAGRKPVAPDGSTLVGASLPTDLVVKLDAYAAKHEVTRAQVIREAVGRFLNDK